MDLGDAGGHLDVLHEGVILDAEGGALVVRDQELGRCVDVKQLQSVPDLLTRALIY